MFSQVVTLAEKAGKHVELMVVPGSDPYQAVVQTAARLESSRIVMGLSPKLTPSEQGAQVGYYWEQLPEPRPSLSLEIVLENQKDTVFFNLGPHPPRLWPEDLDLVHRLWLELSAKGPGSKLHHRDIVGVALRRMNAELHSDLSKEVVGDVLREISTATTTSRRPSAGGFAAGSSDAELAALRALRWGEGDFATAIGAAPSTLRFGRFSPSRRGGTSRKERSVVRYLGISISYHRNFTLFSVLEH